MQLFCCHITAINLRSITDNLLEVSQRFSVWAVYTETASVLTRYIDYTDSAIVKIKQKCWKLSIISPCVSVKSQWENNGVNESHFLR